MALVVENDTGLATADSYVSLVQFRAYGDARLIEGPTDATDEEAEAALRKGFAYVNSNWQYKSAPKVNDQAGEFPRIDLSDGMGRVFNVVPQRVKDAQCEAAISALTEDLFVIADRGGAVQTETVGPISTTYFQGASAEKLFSAVSKLLLPFVRNPDEIRAGTPSYNDYDGSDPVFNVGMDDHDRQNT